MPNSVTKRQRPAGSRCARSAVRCRLRGRRHLDAAGSYGLFWRRAGAGSGYLTFPSGQAACSWSRAGRPALEETDGADDNRCVRRADPAVPQGAAPYGQLGLPPLARIPAVAIASTARTRWPAPGLSRCCGASGCRCRSSRTSRRNRPAKRRKRSAATGLASSRSWRTAGSWLDIQAKLMGADMARYDVQTRIVPERTLLSIRRHLHADETDAFFGDAFARLRSAAPGVEGIAAGALSWCSTGRSATIATGRWNCAGRWPRQRRGPGRAMADVQLRVESAHDEVFIRLRLQDMGWPALMPAVDALEAWMRGQRREPAGALRQVLIADQRTAAPDTRSAISASRCADGAASRTAHYCGRRHPAQNQGLRSVLTVSRLAGPG